MTAFTHANKPASVILLVDDEPDLLQLLRVELEDAGFKTLSASNGHEAIEVMKRATPDAILSDIRMPHGDGLFLLDHVMNERKGHPPVVFISGFADIDEAAAMERGAAGYLHKPIDPQAIAELLRRVTLAPHERWSEPTDASSCKALRLTYPPYDKVKKQGRLSIGRGGFFAACDASVFDDGDHVAFDIDVGTSDRLLGVGIVRWTRTGAVTKGKPGCGIEILSMNDASQKFVQSVLETQPPRAFVPLF